MIAMLAVMGSAITMLVLTIRRERAEMEQRKRDAQSAAPRDTPQP
jgi:hypothetical protein